MLSRSPVPDFRQGLLQPVLYVGIDRLWSSKDIHPMLAKTPARGGWCLSSQPGPGANNLGHGAAAALRTNRKCPRCPQAAQKLLDLANCTLAGRASTSRSGATLDSTSLGCITVPVPSQSHGVVAPCARSVSFGSTLPCFPGGAI